MPMTAASMKTMVLPYDLVQPLVAEHADVVVEPDELRSRQQVEAGEAEIHGRGKRPGHEDDEAEVRGQDEQIARRLPRAVARS